MRGNVDAGHHHRARARAGQAADVPVVLDGDLGLRHHEVALVDLVAGFVEHDGAEQ